MASNHTLVLAAACAFPLSLAACGSSSSSDDDDNSSIVPQGAHHGYVVSKVSIPATTMEASQFGLDLGSQTSAKLDGKTENVLGALLVTLRTIGQFDLQTPITTAINQGTVNLLLDFQTTDFTNAPAAGISLMFGTNPSPPACTDASDTTCGHQLSGSAMFEIATDSPKDLVVAGKVVGGAFSGGPGDVTVKLGLDATTTSTLHLLHGRVRVAAISDTNIMTGTLGGLLTLDELKTQLGPPLKTTLDAAVAADCTALNSPPACGCANASRGSLIMSIVDQDKNCVMTIDEMFGNPTVAGLLTKDSCSQDSCSAPNAFSIAVRFEAVKAMFSM